MHAFTFRNDASLYGFSDPIEEYQTYFRLGIDGVFSDFPDTAFAARAGVVPEASTWMVGMAAAALAGTVLRRRFVVGRVR